MKRGFGLLLALPLLAWAEAPGAPAADEAYLAQQHLCQRMTDIALMALRDRDQGRPARAYPEDGSSGSRIANGLVRKIYAEPGISSPRRAMVVGRAYCLEQLQSMAP